MSRRRLGVLLAVCLVVVVSLVAEVASAAQIGPILTSVSRAN